MLTNLIIFRITREIICIFIITHHKKRKKLDKEKYRCYNTKDKKLRRRK